MKTKTKKELVIPTPALVEKKQQLNLRVESDLRLGIDVGMIESKERWCPQLEGVLSVIKSTEDCDNQMVSGSPVRFHGKAEIWLEHNNPFGKPEIIIEIKPSKHYPDPSMRDELFDQGQTFHNLISDDDWN